jgi:hypothetical protein
VPLEDLDWHDERVRHQVGVHAPVEHVRAAVVARARKQRVAGVEGGAADGVAVVAQRLVRLGGQVEVVPVVVVVVVVVVE